MTGENSATGAVRTPYTRTDWEAATAAVLRKGRRLKDSDPDDAVWTQLTRTTLDGIGVAPIGSADQVTGLVTAGRPTRAGAWDVRTPLTCTDAEATNKAALADLEGGAASLFLTLADSCTCDLGEVVADVLLDLAAVTLDRPTPAQSEALADVLAAYDAKPAAGSNLSADPVTRAMLPHRADDAPSDEELVTLARRAQGLGVLGVVVDATALHEHGASDAQELGWSLAVGVHYLRVLAAAGFSVDEAAGLMEFRYAATDEQFPTIAKLRAARRLWARVLEVSGATGRKQRQHAITSRPMMTRYDPYVNMLRTTVAAFAAGVGGADAVTVLPFDERLGLSEAFGRRIARNTSALLIEESHVAVVTDPAGGSYAVEKLTDDLAGAGWVEFGRIEAEGGVSAEAARAGVKSRVHAVVEARRQLVAERALPITGVSEFPNLEESLPERTPGPARTVAYYASVFEDLRAEPAARPVFLATMGTIASHTARATFASNLLAAGGVAVDTAGATDGVESVIAAYDGQPVVCLAGTDAAYAEWGADLVAALRAAGASYVVLAGKPGERTIPADLIDDSCAMGLDALAFLNRIREALS